MSFFTNGFVLRAPRTAPSNARTTGSAINGVSRDHKPLPTSRDFFDSAGDLLEVSADEYRTAVLDNPQGQAEEYLVWAANSSSLTVLETTDWTVASMSPSTSVSIPTGTITVDDITSPENPTDGSDRLVVLDAGGRGIAQVRLIIILRGDTETAIEVGPDASGGPTFDFASQDSDAGLATLSTAALTALGGGVSKIRGDTITFASYIVAAARFWWTRNDHNVTRFGWNGKTQRWEPYKGGPPKNLGAVSDEGEYTLIPRPTRFSAGSNLPGNPADADVYALLRVGVYPDRNATVPVVVVISDIVAEEGTPDWLGLGNPDVVVGAGNGILLLNPSFVETHAGQTIWYTPEQFESDSVGRLGPLRDADRNPLFLVPIPGATDRPFIRLGFRRYLMPVAVENDAALPAPVAVPSGTVYWSQSTGKIVLSEQDILKADPDDLTGNFDIQYLGNDVYYDGMSMTRTSLRTADPVQLLDNSGSPGVVTSGGHMYVPEAVPLPFPGISGVKFVPDGTGNAPNILNPPGTRPNGSGLVREIKAIGDEVVFTPSKAFTTTEIVEFKKDLVDFPFAMRKTKAQIARELEPGKPGSAVQFKRKGIRGEAIYFLQAEVMPAVYADEARMYSREMEPYEFGGGEKLYFAIDGIRYTWTASVGSFTAESLAADINMVVGGGASVAAIRDRIVLTSATPATGTIEIGFGSTTTFTDRDFSAATIIGFLPGWRIDNSSGDNWLPDNGTKIGLFRSPQNKDRSNDAPDFQNRSSFSGTILSESLVPSPHFLINNPPLQDIAGWDENVFFMTVEGIQTKNLENLIDIYYDFANDRFTWLEQDSVSLRIEQTSDALSLVQAGILGVSMHPAVAPGNGFRLAEDGAAFTNQTIGVDYLLPSEGLQGIAVPIEVIGGKVAEGGAGSFALGTTTFSDMNAEFVTNGVLAGYRLHIIAGDAQGSYIVASDATVETSLEVLPAVPFPVNAGPLNGAPYASWRVHTGFRDTVYDPALVADVQYELFNHLSSEPFQIRLLSSVGAVQASPRNVAVVTEAHQRGREVSIRFALPDGSPTTTLTPLIRGTRLGRMANGSLFVPDVSDTHFINDTFAIRVGGKTYSFGGDLTKVLVFTVPLTGDQIEILDATGELKFGVDTLAELAQSEVSYDQDFLPAVVLAAGAAEYDPGTGELNFSAADLASYTGNIAYFVERMITEEQLDVVVSPVVGSFFFNRPLREGQIVEVSYYAADSQGELVDGVLITEFLPLVVRLETASRVDSTTYTVNPTSRTISRRVEPFIWVDNHLQNFGNSEDVVFDDGTLTFAEEVVASATVDVNYGVLEAFGGEQAYNTSVIPVYRPPFFLEEGQALFVLQNDRTAEMVPGKLFRLGPQPLYIKSSSYKALTNGTSVTVWPASERESGSRSPAEDSLTLLSSVPVTDEVDGVPTGGSTGFLMSLTVTYEPVDKGMISIIFHGNLTQYAVAGHLLEIGGYPFIIVNSELAEDGRTTIVHLTTAAPTGFNDTVDAVKISVRPIYQPNPRSFLGINPFVASDFTELVLFGETAGGVELPGRVLTPKVHYTVNSANGDIELLEPLQAPLQGGQRLFFSYSRLKVLGPFLEDGAVIYPRYEAGYSYISGPSQENGLQGSILAAKYTFRSPDSFYYRTVPLTSYMGEVAKLVVSRVQAQSPAGGAMVVSGASTNNYDQGRMGFEALKRDLLDQDRAARTFIELYNAIVVAFEQVSETITGEVVGDHDGKFRFFIGRGKTYPAPGYEDEITGELIARFVWGDVFEAANGTIHPTLEDIIADPETATLVDGEVDGDAMDPLVLQFYVDEQKRYVANDMDDIILAGFSKPRFLGGFPFPKFKLKGDFRSMWEPHRISRLFPEATLAFSTTFPGLLADVDNGDPGVYAFLKVLDPPKLFKKGDEDVPLFGSTFGKPIGVVSNPVLGAISDISDIETRNRLPRARIWAYSPDGFPDIDGSTDGYATIIATVGFIKDFPVNSNTGLPDVTRFLSQGGDLPDISTGDPELSTPAFWDLNEDEKIAQQVAFGRPSGETLAAGNAQQTFKTLFAKVSDGFDISPVYGGVFVGTVLQGCLIVLADNKGKFLSGSDVLALGVGELTGDPVELNQGDTIYAIPPGSQDSSKFSDPPTVEELEQFADAVPSLDVGVSKRSGLWKDRSLPSFQDPFPFGVKEIMGQKVPPPMSAIEADVEFRNSNRDPTEIPALRGEPTNDSGDFSIPYLAFGNTELDRLGEVASAFVDLQQTDSPTPQAVYPDEVIVDDGVIDDVYVTNPPATLITTAGEFTPVVGPYIPFSGVGNVARYDLLLVELGQTSGIQAGATGILSVGEVTSTTVEVPRFISQSFGGLLIKYTLDNAMSHVSSTFATGMVITRVGTLTTFDISTTGAPFLNDGTSAPSVTGGLNHVLGANNALVIRIYENGGSGTPGTLVEEIVVTGSMAHGGAGADIPVTLAEADEKELRITTLVPFVANTGVLYDYTLTIDTYIDATTDALITTLGGTSPGVGGGTGSITAWVGDDRLTFNERVDLTTAPQRGTLNPAALDISAGLSVWRVTASGILSSINRPASVNNSLPLTFLTRDGTGDVGTFQVASGAGAGDELGTVKAMSWEAGNTPVGPLTGVVVAGVPSSNESGAGVICTGTGEHHDDETSIVSIPDVSVVGSVANAEPGDILVVKQSAAGDSAVTTGTYLIRHAIEDNTGVSGGYREAALTGMAGPGGQWINGIFPTIVSATLLTLEVVVTDLGAGPSGGTLWDETSAMNRLFLIRNAGDPTSVISMEIASIDVGAKEFTLVSGTGLEADGTTVVSDGNFFMAAVTGTKVSGFRYLPISTSGSPLGSGLPSNSVVGFDSGTSTAFGLLNLIISNPTLTQDAITFQSVFAYPGSIVTGTTTDGSGKLGVVEADVVDNKLFQVNEEAVVYGEVAGWMDLLGIPATGGTRNWEAIHGDTTIYGITLAGVRCLLPMDKFAATDLVLVDGNPDPVGNIGFQAEAGIYTEPSWARPIRPLDTAKPHIVDAGHPAGTLNQIGMRNPSQYGLVSPETVVFEVRRIRRFHEQLGTISANLTPLRYAYETRRGVVASYTASTRTLVASTPTQLGGFTSEDVNVNPGDEIRILDATGHLADKAEIAVIVDGITLVLRSPGLTAVTIVGGETLEVYLKQAPVPHEQSNDQLLEVITEEVIHETVANPLTTPSGAYVTTANQLQDTTVVDFTALGIQVGDIIVVDPAGDLSGPGGPANPLEKGTRPFGDTSVLGRAPYNPGEPSELDDNRGFYRVTSINVGYLGVSGVSEFSGADGANVTFGSGDTEYAVLPTITGSTTPTSGSGTTEGQQDLRITSPADGANSYKGNQYSIEPFSYRVIRPTSLISSESIDLVLFMRGQMLSFMEEMESSMSGGKSGDYYIFQRDQHCTDLGSPTNPDAGLGIIHNSFVEGLAGLINVSPYANVSDCLAILDRRFWILDTRLDSETPPNDPGTPPPYAFFEDGDGRPVLPDLIAGVLNYEDRLRELRFAWIRFRTDSVNGSLPAIERFLLELPRRIQEQEDLLKLQEGLKAT